MTSKPRVEVLDRRLVCRNSLFDVFLDNVVDQSGLRVTDYLAVVPRHLDASGCVGVAMLPIRDGKVGLARVFRHPQGVVAWEMPKGFIEKGELPEQAAVRELKEESGYIAGKLENLGCVSPVPSVLKAKVQLFAALCDTPPHTQSGSELGHGSLEFFDTAELLAMAREGEIEDACTLVALYRYVLGGRSA